LSSPSRSAIVIAVVVLAAGAGLLIGRWNDDEETQPADPPVPPPSRLTAYQADLAAVTGQLAEARSSHLETLDQAERRSAQAEALAALAGSYSGAARGLTKATPPGELVKQTAGAEAALRETAAAYRRLAKAADAGDRTAYRRARSAAQRAESQAAQQLTATLNAAEGMS
jgi:hypothetical protein